MRGGWFGVKWVVFENFDRKDMLGGVYAGSYFRWSPTPGSLGPPFWVLRWSGACSGITSNDLLGWLCCGFLVVVASGGGFRWFWWGDRGSLLGVGVS